MKRLLAAFAGLIDLIARGYGWLAWAVIAIYAVPLLSLGTWRIFVRPHTTPASGERVLPWTAAALPESIGISSRSSFKLLKKRHFSPSLTWLL